MTAIWRIFRKETQGYLQSPATYIFLTTFVLVSFVLFFTLGRFFQSRFVSLDTFFALLPWYFLFLIPAIAMRVWAEEKRAGTDELLLTLPVRDYEVVIGKYLAALGLIVVALLLTLPLAGIMQYFADKASPLDWGPIYTSYFAAVLLGAAFLAAGTWASSLTRNQIVAFIVGCAVCFALFLIGLPVIMERIPGGQAILPWSLYTKYSSMYRGVVDLSDVVACLSYTSFFLFLNIRAIESRKWS